MQFADGRIVVSAEPPIGWLLFNQPDRLNAVRLDMWRALPDAIAALERQSGVRVLVCMGAGDKAFISGADIAEFEEVRHDAATNRVFTEAVLRATSALSSSDLPSIAMIQGYCIGGGVVIASACDLRICSEGSRFGVPAGRLGLGYEYDNVKRLSVIVGPAVALDMILSGRHFTSNEALACGYVNRVVATGDLRASVTALAAQIAANAPLSLAAAKVCIRALAGEATPEQAQAAIDACFDSADYREGRAAFHARREPRFEGR